MDATEVQKLKDQYEALVKELHEVGVRLGATAGIMPFVKALPTQQKDYARYAEIWDELGRLRNQLNSN